MKNILKTILLLTILLVSGCTMSDGYLFGPSTPPDYVEIKKGDTLYSISRKYDVPLRDLIEINDLTPPYNLMIGQSLTMPSNRYHVVSKGDTLYNVSKRYDVNVNSLSKANDLKAPYTLSIGDKLALPASISSNPTETAQYTPVNQPTKSYWSKPVAKTKAKPVAKTKAPAKKAYIAPVKKRNAKFAWPVKGPIISNFGAMGKGRKNDGINIKAPAGTAVNAADKGTIVYAGNELKGFGNLILIKHPDGWVTAYAHNERIFVRKGQSVRKGEKISAVGKTGGINTPQLHFEIHANKKPVNPMSHLE